MVILAVALGSRLSTRPSGRSAPSPLEAVKINGLFFNDTRERATNLLGKPSCEGPLEVGKNGQDSGWYAEWGGAGKVTWNGSPTVTFWPDGRILSTIGTNLVCPDHELSLGSSEQQVVGVLGPAAHSVGDTSNYEAPGLRLHLTYDDQRKLRRILRESLL